MSNGMSPTHWDEVDAFLQDKAREILANARADLGEDLSGFSPADLLADNLPLSLESIYALLEDIGEGMERTPAGARYAEPNAPRVHRLVRVSLAALEFVGTFTGHGAPCRNWPKWWDHEATQGDNRNEDRLRKELEEALGPFVDGTQAKEPVDGPMTNEDRIVAALEAMADSLARIEERLRVGVPSLPLEA